MGRWSATSRVQQERMQISPEEDDAEIVVLRESGILTWVMQQPENFDHFLEELNELDEKTQRTQEKLSSLAEIAEKKMKPPRNAPATQPAAAPSWGYVNKRKG